MSEPSGFSLRAMRTGDIPDGLRLCRAAGWNQRAEDWQAMLGLDPGAFVVAVADGRVVGTGGAVRYGPDLAWVCMILVDPESRSRGLGTAIMAEVLRRLADMALVGLDATPGGRLVYVKLGFRDGRALARFEARPASAPPLPAPAARPMSGGDMDAVLAWDREAFGADRAAVLRWEHAQAPEYAWTVPDAGGLAGYCFGRHGHNAEQVGPVVARDAATARQLVQACLSRRSGARFFLDAPREPAAWTGALADIGFVEQRPFTRMYRGEAREPGRPEWVFAVTGPEFG